VPVEILHQLRTLEDFAPNPRDSAIATVIGYLATIGGPESRPQSVTFTDLDVDQALAYPQDFRGGLVRVRGQYLGVDTRSIQHPAIADPEGWTYRGYLFGKGRAGPVPVLFQGTMMPPDVPRDTPMEVEGVFLQAVQYETKDGKTRTAPFLVASSVRAVKFEAKRSILDTLFLPIVCALIILIVMTTLYLFKKSRVPARSRYVARPPGPGR
jgi:hypothetical protein